MRYLGEGPGGLGGGYPEELPGLLGGGVAAAHPRLAPHPNCFGERSPGRAPLEPPAGPLGGGVAGGPRRSGGGAA